MKDETKIEVLPLIAYRIADSRYPIYDPTGAMISGGRWNSIGKQVIYASESYAAAMLEILAHRNAPMLPKYYQAIHILIPSTITIETILPDDLPGWDDQDERTAKVFGDAWYDSKRTLVLRVPSVVTHGPEFNLVLNATHPDFQLIQAGAPMPIVWDERLMQAKS